MTINVPGSANTILSAQGLVRNYIQSDCLPSVSKGDGRVHSIRRISHQDVDIFSGQFLDEVEIAVRHDRESMSFVIPLDGGMEVKTANGRTLDGRAPIAFEASDCRLLRMGEQRSHLRVSVAKQSIHKHLSVMLEKPIVRPITFSETLSNPAAAQAVAAAVKFLLLASKGNHDPRPEVVAGYIVATLLQFWPHSHLDLMNRDQTKVLPRHVKAAIEIIRSDPFGKISLNELAKRTSVSPRTLQYGFQNFKGKSLSEFQHEVKMQSLQDLVRKVKGDIPALRESLPDGKLSALKKQYRSAFGISLNEHASIVSGRPIHK